MDLQQLSEEELNEIYNWVDEVPLSRPKKNISRDFADGVMVAEIISHFLPHLIQVHNYSSASSVQKKKYNWETLNVKVFKKLGFQVSKMDIEQIINAVPEAVEKILKILQERINQYGNPSHQHLSSSQNIYESNKSLGNKMNSIVSNQNVNIKQMQPVNVQAYENTILELRETVDILEIKIQKLEDLVKLKDNKIQVLTRKLQDNGLI